MPEPEVAPTAAGRLVSVNVGLPKDFEWEGRIIHTGVWKAAIEGRRAVRRLNVDGDGQGDRAGHGGVNRAVFVYQLDSYRFWQHTLSRDDFEYGQFGENFTVEGLPDAEVCVGDQYRIGSALFEVSQPRVTCYRVGIRMREPRMPALLVAHHRPGFYLRVLEEGDVGAGDDIERVRTGPEAMTIAEIDALLYLPGHARRDLIRALRIPALSEGWQGSFRELLEQIGGGTAPQLAWTGMRPMRVTAIEPESTNVVSLRLVPADGTPAAPARAGQFLTVRLHPRSVASPVLRTYSLSDRPSSDGYRVSVKREPHGIASEYLWTQVSVGDILEAGAPRGSFVLRPGDRPVVLISAGVGATPVLAMLHVLAAARSPRPVWWLHGARDQAEHSFAGEASGLLAQLPEAHRVICYTRPGPDDHGFDRTGRLTGGTLDSAGVPTDADCYLCGPVPFMHDLAAALVARGTAPERIHTERFGPDDAITPGIAAPPARAPHAPAGTPGTGPAISFGRSNLSVPWDSSFANLLEFAEACDVPVRWSCRTGVCHTCETGLISGGVDYRPDPLEPPAAGDVLICCSSPRGEVTLDL
jgi:ferredoxin-NADP reductase/MOSC domain-containing protein YiiM/ferredoxin